MKQEIADELYRRIERHITNESETRAVKTVLNNWAAEQSPLTEAEIESAGWEHITFNRYKIGWFTLMVPTSNQKATIVEDCRMGIELFRGNIPTAHHLKLLMEMLNIKP